LLQWTVIDGGCGIINENGGNIFIERTHIYGFICGIVFDQTEIASIRDCQIDCLNGIWLVNANERNNASTASAQPGTSTNVIRIYDCGFNSGGIAFADSGGATHVFRGCNFEGSGGDFQGNSWPSWYIWATGVAQGVFSDWESEGAYAGAYFGPHAPFTGRWIFHRDNMLMFPSDNIKIENALIAVNNAGSNDAKAAGPAIDFQSNAGTPAMNVSIQLCEMTTNSANAPLIRGVDVVNGLSLKDNIYASTTPTFDATIAGGGLFFYQQSSSAAPGPGLGLNCVPHVGLDLNTGIALRSVNLTLANGANHNVPNPGRSSVEITSPTAAFSISGIAGGTEGQIIELANLTAFPMTIVHQDATSDPITSPVPATLPSNRFICPGAANLILTPGSGGVATVRIRYSSSQSRWLVVGHT
jgi:hypothetical protein